MSAAGPPHDRSAAAGRRPRGPPARAAETRVPAGGGAEEGRIHPAARGLVVALAAITFAGCWIEPADRAELEEADSGPTLEERVRTMLEASAAAWNRGDLEGFMAVYLKSPRTTYVGGGGLRVGYDAIRRRYAPLFAPGVQRDSLRFEDLSVRSVSDGVAVGTARWVLHRAGEITGSGPFTMVLRRVEGAWKIVHDHSSSSPAESDDEPE